VTSSKKDVDQNRVGRNKKEEEEEEGEDTKMMRGKLRKKKQKTFCGAA